MTQCLSTCQMLSRKGTHFCEDLEEELDLEKGQLSEPKGGIRKGTTSKGLGGRSPVGFSKESGHKSHGNGVCHRRRTRTMRCMAGGLSETRGMGQESLLDTHRCEPQSAYCILRKQCIKHFLDWLLTFWHFFTFCTLAAALLILAPLGAKTGFNQRSHMISSPPLPPLKHTVKYTWNNIDGGKPIITWYLAVVWQVHSMRQPIFLISRFYRDFRTKVRTEQLEKRHSRALLHVNSVTHSLTGSHRQ